MKAAGSRRFDAARGSSARAALVLVVAFGVACDDDVGAGGPALRLPDRPGNAPGGEAVVRAVRSMDLADRESILYAEFARGNVPAWLRVLRPVEVAGDVDGTPRTVTFWVTPDYLSVGSDDDYTLVPLTAQTAQRIADLAGASLPTPRMVDAIWASAEHRVDPIRLRPDEDRGTVETFVRHDRLVKAQRRVYKAKAGEFFAGHKVDVVLTATLLEKPGKGAHYGWHRSTGQPIQGFFTDASDSVVIFSHGVRLVHRSVLVDGVAADLWAVLADPALAPLLSRQGVITHARYPDVVQ